MALETKTSEEILERIRKCVEDSYNTFQDNNKRFSDSMRFLFKSTLSEYDKSMLAALGRPQLEFNVLEPYVSRLLGEWSKQIPDVTVHSSEDPNTTPPAINPANPADPSINPVTPSTPTGNNITTVVEAVEGIIKHILCAADNNSFGYRVYKEVLGGGFSVMKITTDYVNVTSFEQEIKLVKVFDPTLTFFDPLSRLPDKSDGKYCGEIYPKTEEEFKNEFPNEDLDQFNFYSSNIDGFNWSYTYMNKKVIMLADFYEKEEKRVRLHQLSNGETLTEKEYNKFLLEWDEKDTIEVAPAIVQSRWTTEIVIMRYVFLKDRILKKEETPYPGLPLFFCDGHSAYLKSGDGDGPAKQFTRPYIYNAMGAQKLKNWAGASQASELENIIQSQYMAAVESIPDGETGEAWTKPQEATTLLYNSKDENDNPLPPPIKVQRGDVPPVIASTFSGLDQTIQGALGTFDAQLGTQDDLSGKAIIESTTNNNAVAMPYVEGYLAALNTASQMILKMIPFYYNTPRSVPVRDKTGRAAYIPINQPSMDPNQPPIRLEYDPTVFGVTVKAGYNFEVQRSRALSTIVQLMNVSPSFAQMMNGPGLPILVNNLDINGSEELQDLVNQQMQQQAQQAASQPQIDPKIQVQMGKLQLQQQQMQANMQKDAADNQIKQQQLQMQLTTNQLKQAEIDNQRLQMTLNAQAAGNSNDVQLIKAQTEIEKAKVTRDEKAGQFALASSDQTHQHAKDLVGNSNPQQPQGE